MGGGGSGNSVFEDIVNVVTQVSTGGLVGFESDKGGLTGGVTTRGVVNVVEPVIKDITGATALEEANRQARSRFEEEKAAALKQRKEVKSDTARQQLIASRLAAGVRRGGGAAGGKGSRATKLGSDESDFLGL